MLAAKSLELSLRVFEKQLGPGTLTTQGLGLVYPGYQSQQIIKRKNKEGKKVGSGQMVTSIVGIDQ